MRTKHSYYNFLVNIISNIILPVLGFLKVRYFLQLYGSDVNGLQLFMSNVIMFLNVCELAYSLAFRQLLYKPLAEGNKEKVLKIYHGARKVFRITGYAVLALGILTSFGVYFFSSERPVAYLETVILFLILFIPFGLSYFLMGPSFVIAADQKEYKVSIWIQLISILRMVLMIGVILLKLPFIWIFIIEGAQVLIANFVANRIAIKNYPWLNEKTTEPETKEFIHNAKYTVVQRFATLAGNTDNIVITYFLGLTSGSIYGAYNYLTDAIMKIIQSAITSPINSFGNLFHDKKGDSYGVFTEYYNLSSYIATIIAVCVFIVLDQFVLVWIGNPEYILPISASILMALNIYYITQKEAIIIVRDANGLFKEARNNAYMFVVVKLVLSVILIMQFDIIGILLATFLSYWTVDLFYNPILIYKKVFQLNPLRYYFMFFIRLLFGIILAISLNYVWTYIFPVAPNSLFSFLSHCIILGITTVIAVTIGYFVAFKSFRDLCQRMYKMILRKK